MASKRGDLKPAHRGYHYQDIATAYMLIRALIENYDEVIIDRKLVDDDRFDDLEVKIAGKRVRRQFKSSQDLKRALKLNDFLGKNSSLRFDRLVLTDIRADKHVPIKEYRLCATWQPPTSNDNLIKFLKPVDAAPTFVDSAPLCYRLDAGLIWPEGQPLAWSVLEPYIDTTAGFDRNAVVNFCNNFLIELKLPIASTTFEAPGEFEKLLLDILKEKIGIGRYPNDKRQLQDVAAFSVELAIDARTKGKTLRPTHIAQALNIRMDFGRVPQSFPIDFSLFHHRPKFRESLYKSAMKGGIHLVLGHPGAGKSWELTQLAEELKQANAIVARHYCYLEPGDDLVERRVTTNVFFANLLAELSDSTKMQGENHSNFFSAGLKELEITLSQIRASYTQPIILIIDGLDHIARIRSASSMLNDKETDIVEQLSMLTIPPGITIIIGSQPGEHLSPLRERWSIELAEHKVPAWSAIDVIALANLSNIKHFLEIAGIKDDRESNRFLTLFAQRTEGNPLYARYLINNLISDIRNGDINDLQDWLSKAPVIAGDIAVYYKHLYSRISQQAQIIADLFGIIDFAISENELHEIIPAINSWIQPALAALSPILIESTGQGGYRIFHESFRRFMLEELERQGRKLGDILVPLISWFQQKDFYKNAKCYRFLLPALRRADREKEVSAYITEDFISKSVSQAYSIEAIQKNLELATDIAGRNRNWPFLVRCSELWRALFTCFEEKNDSWDEFWITYITLYGADKLAERLLFEGRPTHARNNGLLACSLIDDVGGIAPWQEYLDLYDDPGSRNERIDLAMVHGRLRLGNFWSIIKRTYSYICRQDNKLHLNFIRQLASRITRMISSEIVEQMASRANSKRRIRPSITTATILRLGIADEYQRQGKCDITAKMAMLALDGVTSAELAVECLQLGASSIKAAVFANVPSSIPIIFEDNEYWDETFNSNMHRWVDSIRLLATTSEGKNILKNEFTRIQGTGWYRCWLRFTLDIAIAEAANRSSQDYDIVSAFSKLIEDIAPFHGHPRPCDLYPIWDVINKTLVLSLSLLQTITDWEHALKILDIVSKGTSSYLDRAESGPLARGTLIKILFPYINHPIVGAKVQLLIERKITEAHATGEYYATHAEYSMFLARTLFITGKIDLAQQTWDEVGIFLTGYGWHKDITLFNLIESIPFLVSSSQDIALSALQDLQPLIKAVLIHTDGKATRNSPNAWFASLVEVSPIIAIDILVQTIFQDDYIENWRTIEAIKNIANHLLDKADPLLLDALLGTLLFEVEYENLGEATAQERLAPIKLLIHKYPSLIPDRLRTLATESKNDSTHYAEDAIKLVKTTAFSLGLTLPDMVIKENNQRKKIYQTEFRKKKMGFYNLRILIFPAQPTLIDILTAIRKIENQRNNYDSDALDDIVLCLSYRLGIMVDNDQEAEARRIIYFLTRNIRMFFYNKIQAIKELAAALDNAGYASLASIMYGLTYTSQDDRAIGNYTQHTYHDALLRGLQLDRTTTLQTVADETAYRLNHTTDYSAGISSSLIEYLAKYEGAEIAVEAWREAFNVIKKRLPLPSDCKGLFAILDQKQISKWHINEALLLLLLYRISEPRLSRKLSALAGIVRAIQHCSDVLVSPLRWWLSRNSNLSSILLVLQILLSIEPKPYKITEKLQNILLQYYYCDSKVLSELSSLLLERAQIPIKYKPQYLAKEVCDFPLLSSQAIEKLLVADEGKILNKFSSIWSDLSIHIAKHLNLIQNNSTNKRRIQNRYDLFLGQERKSYPPTPILRWETELFISVLGNRLNELSEHLWKTGNWDAKCQHDLIISTLPNTTIHLALNASRTIRPNWPEPSTLESGNKSLTSLTEDDPIFPGWTRLGYIETQAIKSSNPPYLVTRIVKVFSGAMTIPLIGGINSSSFPFKKGEIKNWGDLPNCSSFLSDSIPENIVCLSKVHDWLGEVLVLIPPIELNYYITFLKPQFGEPLVWHDLQGLPAVVLRTWRVRDYDIFGAEPASLCGSDLIIRPDVMKYLQWMCNKPLIELMIVEHHEI